MNTPPAEPLSILNAGSPAASAAGRPRESFIPLRKAELIEALVRSAKLSHDDERAFCRLARLFSDLSHHVYFETLETLKDAYAPFDPDSDTPPRAALSVEAREAQRQRVFDCFGWLLERGNFIRLAKDEINAALDERSHWGLNLKVDFEVFERLEVYYRGDTVVQRMRRRVRGAMRKEAVDVPVYQRLVLIFRFRPNRPFSKYLDTDDVYIKLFKEIPKVDLDMLLPGTQVQMSLTDQAKIILPTFSGLTIAAAKAFFAFGPAVGMWGLVGGTLGYGVRSVYGYMNTRQKYQLNLTQSLYFQNIDNNAGVIYRMVDEAEEQDTREALLAYFFLWQTASPDGCPPPQLDAAIEAFVDREIRLPVDFEIADALEKLARWDLASSDSHGRWRAVPVGEAVARLTVRWRQTTGGDAS